MMTAASTLSKRSVLRITAALFFLLKIKIRFSFKEIPQQLNGSDCGVFACTFAEFLGRDAALSFQQNDMPLIRRTMVWEIAKGILTR